MKKYYDNMKKFFAPTIEIVKLDANDIIATSGELSVFEEFAPDAHARELDSDWDW